MKSKKAFSLNKYNEYSNIVSSIILKLRTENIEDYLYTQIATDLVKSIRNKDTQAATYLTIVPASFMASFIDEVASNVRNILTIKFRKQIQELWSKSFGLGRKHMVADMLFNLKPLKKTFSGITKFNSLTGYSLLDFYSNDDIAEFADEDISDKDLRLRIARAKRNLTILKANVTTLKAQEILYDDFNLYTSSGDIARYTIEQKVKYLETLLEVENFIRKSELAEKNFLGNEYFNRRYKVLTDDYLANYDLYIKDQISSYLNKNIEGVRQIQNTKIRSDILINNIKKQLQEAKPNRVDPLIKSERILKTELSIAYNFGKLSGFTSPEDLDRKFKWNADWELESKRSDYEICEFCKLMDGRIYTARDLLITGTRLDRGILRYEGKTRTDWKNPSLAQIPFHPQCNCFTADVNVDMSYGNIKIADVKEGEYVKVPTSDKYLKVTKTHKNWYDGKLRKIKIKTREGSEKTITCTPNHPLWTQEGWKTAGSIRSTDILYSNFENVGLQNTSIKNSLSTRYTRKSLYPANKSRLEINRFNGRVVRIKASYKKFRSIYRFKKQTLFQKWLGIKCSKNIKSLKYSMGIRTSSNKINRWNNLFTRFLSSYVQSLYRSKREMERQCKAENRMLQEHGLFHIDNRCRNIQGFESNFQELSEVGIITIEDINYKGYVYNLSIDKYPIYFANSILAHNCYWTLVDKGSDDDTVDLEVDRPLLDEAPGIPGTQLEIQNNLLPNAIGAGLVVGGMFLLARSNAWRIFYNTVKTVGETVTPQTSETVVSGIVKVGKYIQKEFPVEVNSDVKNIVAGLLS